MASNANHSIPIESSPSDAGPKGNLPSLRQTDTSVTLPPDVYEAMYLQPQLPVKGDLRKTFGNPTPLCLVGFVVSAFPLSCDLLGWRGAGGNAAASVGIFLYMGGLLSIIGSVLEFFLGNTFSFVVFGSLAGFWFAYGATLQPYNNATEAYGGSIVSPGFAASFGFVLLAMGIIAFFFFVCSFRINVLQVITFACLTTGFNMLAGAFWQVAQGNYVLAVRLEHAAGGILLVPSFIGFMIIFGQLLESVDFPITIPVGDLSGLIKGKRQRAAEKAERIKAQQA